MRLFLLFLLAAPAPAGEILLEEMRAWEGHIRIEARTEPGKNGRGANVQTEEVRFVVLTDPRHTAGERERLTMRLREAKGEWSLLLDLKEDRGTGELSTEGRGGGPLHFELNGVIDVEKRTVRFKTGAKPHRLIARTSLTGIDEEGPASFRTVASSTPFMAALDEAAELSEDGRTASGEHSFTDRRGKYAREVTVSWSLTRLDPAVRGRVVDQDGVPIAGLKVIARTWGSGRMLARDAETDDDGRFSIPAHFATWGVQVKGVEQDGIVTAGVTVPDAATIRLEDIPELEIRLTRYRLARLPRPELLERFFEGDVDRYVAYLAERTSPQRMAAARVKRATR